MTQAREVKKTGGNLISFEEFEEKHKRWVLNVTYPQRKDVVGIVFWSRFSKDPKYKVTRILLREEPRKAYEKIMSNPKYRKVCSEILGL